MNTRDKEITDQPKLNHFDLKSNSTCNIYIRLCKQNVFYCFYKITSSKNYNEGKDKFILLIKMYLPTTKWHFSTDQSKLTFENLAIGKVVCLQLVYRHTTMFTYSHASMPLSQSGITKLRF